MARKYDLISELYNRTCKTVVSNPQNWQAFLASACRNYKLRYDPGFVPLVAKETKGHSFPSRHALSASVLVMVWMYFYPKAGWMMVGITVLICVGRVLTGVHHIRDVVGGAALGFALDFAGMWLL